jgi:hypothetical protein
MRRWDRAAPAVVLNGCRALHTLHHGVHFGIEVRRQVTVFYAFRDQEILATAEGIHTLLEHATL